MRIRLLLMLLLAAAAVSPVQAQVASGCGFDTPLIDPGCPPPRVDVGPPDGFAPTDTAFAHDIGFVSDNVVTHALNDFPGQTVNGANAQPMFAYDWDPTATTLYGIDNTALMLGQMSLNGVFTPIGAVTPMAGHTVTGLTIHPGTGDAYMSSTDGTTSVLYNLDLTSGATTMIGVMGPALIIDIALNCQGEMYAHDIGDDNIYTVNVGTGAATAVGPTGVDSNFAQGMDFDADDGTLYAYTYQGGGANVYGTINLGTGALTPLATSNPQGEFEGAVQTICFVPVELQSFDVE